MLYLKCRWICTKPFFGQKCNPMPFFFLVIMYRGLFQVAPVGYQYSIHVTADCYLHIQELIHSCIWKADHLESNLVNRSGCAHLPQIPKRIISTRFCSCHEAENIRLMKPELSRLQGEGDVISFSKVSLQLSHTVDTPYHFLTLCCPAA